MDVDVCTDVGGRRVACEGVHGWSGEHVTGWCRDGGLVLVLRGAILVRGGVLGSGRASRARQRPHWSFCTSSLVVGGAWDWGGGMAAWCSVLCLCVL